MNGQSVLTPFGPEADSIAELSWVLFASGAAIFVLTMVLAGLALHGGDRIRRVLASRRAIVVGGIAFPVVVLTALLFYTLKLTHALHPIGREAPLRIEVTGKQYWWEVRYPAHDIVTANEIHIPVGQPVELLLDSGDVIHSLWIPALHGKRDMIPGRVNTLRFSAGTPGVLRGQCAEFCGAQHARMAFQVVVHPPETFALWLDRQRAPVTVPQDPRLAEGWRAFGAAGCGGCHAIRGTPWTGRTGPNLTAVGARLSLGAGMLKTHRESFAVWIAAPQAVKPGNAMPAFGGILDAQEVRSIAAWLESLK